MTATKPSPFIAKGIICVVCSRIVQNKTEIAEEICNKCYLAGWRPVNVAP